MFVWEITQAGADELFDTPDDIHSQNQIVLPVGTRLKLSLRSQDVLHGFFVPRLGVRQSLPPGVTFEKELILTQPGQHRFACSEVCGAGHGKMMGYLIVLPREEYGRWIQARSKEKNALEPSG
jgi:cytochrome c oxidase subunit 2